jgi:hypothetical protein
LPDDTETIPAPLGEHKPPLSAIPPPQEIACTKEAKQCPDGSVVGRSGPKCEFAACPTAPSTVPADWKTYRNEQYGFEMRYPNEWKVTDISSTNSGKEYVGVTVKSPSRLDLAGYQNEPVYYLIHISGVMGRDDISTVADFATDKAGQQSPWNTEISDELRKSTEEYKIGQEIIASFKFTK